MSKNFIMNNAEEWSGIKTFCDSTIIIYKYV